MCFAPQSMVDPVFEPQDSIVQQHAVDASRQIDLAETSTARRIVGVVGNEHETGFFDSSDQSGDELKQTGGTNQTHEVIGLGNTHRLLDGHTGAAIVGYAGEFGAAWARIISRHTKFVAKQNWICYTSQPKDEP